MDAGLGNPRDEFRWRRRQDGVGDDPRRGEVQRIFPGYHHQPDRGDRLAAACAERLFSEEHSVLWDVAHGASSQALPSRRHLVSVGVTCPGRLGGAGPGRLLWGRSAPRLRPGRNRGAVAESAGLACEGPIPNLVECHGSRPIAARIPAPIARQIMVSSLFLSQKQDGERVFRDLRAVREETLHG